MKGGLRQAVLQPRLNTILNMLTPCNRLVDIGTDHALLAIEALKTLNINTVTATDISKAAVDKAQRAVNAAGLADRVDVFQSDGFESIETDFEQAVLAGMGGPLIIKILDQANRKIRPGTRLLVQPQNEYSYVREWLWNNEYHTEYEKIVVDKRYLYVVMAVEKAEDNMMFDSRELVIGRNVIYDDIDVYVRYLNFLSGVRESTLEQIKNITDRTRVILGMSVDKYIEKLDAEMQILQKELARCKHK